MNMLNMYKKKTVLFASVGIAHQITGILVRNLYFCILNKKNYGSS